MYERFIIVQKIGGKNYYFAGTLDVVFFDTKLGNAHLFSVEKLAELKIKEIQRKTPNLEYYVQTVSITIEFN